MSAATAIRGALADHLRGQLAAADAGKTTLHGLAFDKCDNPPCTNFTRADRQRLLTSGGLADAYVVHQADDGHTDSFAACGNGPCDGFFPTERHAWLVSSTGDRDHGDDAAHERAAAANQAAPEDELVAWWKQTAAHDIEQSAAKIREYGGEGPAHDLVQVGDLLQRLQGNDLWDVELATELGILFYLRSKVARWEAAVLDGRRPSDDTLYDISYYSMMARRNRAVGGWPEGPK